MPLTLDDFSVYWPYRNAGEAAADNLTKPASPVQAQKNMEVIRDIFLASESSLDGRSILEATPVVDAEEEFAPGGTFTLNRANLRHRAIKVSDGSNPLTAPMTVSLNPSDDWVAGDVVIITKGDSSDNNITVTGFDLDGLGDWTLKTEWDAVYCLVQSVDGSEVGTGQGPNQDIKFERVMRIRQSVTGDLADVATTGDYNDLTNLPALPPLDALAEDDVCGGTLTAAVGDVDLSGTDDGYVLTQDASGNLSFEAPASTASGVEFDGDPVTELLEGSNITFVYSGGVLTLNVSSGSATVGDGDYGDIVVSGTGTTYTIDTGVVTNAKMADMAEATFKMRADGAGTGAPIDGTAAQARTALNVADGATANTGALADLDTVDTAQIDDGAITTTKVADLAAYSVIIRAADTTGPSAAVQATTDTLLGRGNSGNLGFRKLTNEMVPDGEIDLAKLTTATQDLINATITYKDSLISGLTEGTGTILFEDGGVLTISSTLETESYNTARRPTTAEVFLDASDRPITVSGVNVRPGGAVIIKADTEAVAVRVQDKQEVDSVWVIVVDPDSTYPVTLERTIDVLELSGNVSGTTITNIDTTNVLAGQAISVFKDTGTEDEFGNPITALVSNPAAVIDSVTQVSVTGSLEMDIAATEAATGAIVEVTAGEKGLLNGQTGELTLLPGTTTVRLFDRDPWTNLMVEGPEVGRFLLGDEITANFTLALDQRGRTISVNAGSDVTCTLDELPAGLWASFDVKGAGKLVFADGTATARTVTGKTKTVPSTGSIMVRYISETDVRLDGTLEDV